MPVKPHANEPSPESWLMRGVRAWAVGAGVVLGLMGFMLLLASAEDGPLWQRADAILGVSTRTMLLVGNLLHLLLAGYMAFSRNLLNQAFLALWLGLNYTVYRVGLVWLGVKGGLPVLRCIGTVVGIKPSVLSAGWTLFIIYLVAGGVVVLVMERQRWKRIEAESFMERWRKMRKQSGGVSTMKPRPATGGKTSHNAAGGGA